MGTLIQFFKDSWSEIRKVSWPKTDDLIKHTTRVVIFVVIFAAISTLIDFGMKSLYTALPASNTLPSVQSTAPASIDSITASGANIDVIPSTTIPTN